MNGWRHPNPGTNLLHSSHSGNPHSVKGLLNLAAGSILASVIKSDHRVPGNPALIDKVDGVVSSVDAGNGNFTVSITESEGFLPVFNPDGTITVRVDTATLRDNIGGIINLAPRMGVEVLGS